MCFNVIFQLTHINLAISVQKHNDLRLRSKSPTTICKPSRKRLSTTKNTNQNTRHSQLHRHLWNDSRAVSLLYAYKQRRQIVKDSNVWERNTRRSAWTWNNNTDNDDKTGYLSEFIRQPPSSYVHLNRLLPAKNNMYVSQSLTYKK